MKTTIKIVRWIGVAILPMIVAIVLEIVLNFLFRYIFFAVFWNWNVAFYAAQFLANVVFGPAIPMVAGIVAPAGKKIAAVVVTSIASCMFILSSVLSLAQGNYFVMVTNLVSMAAAIATTVYIYRLVEASTLYRVQSSDVIDVGESDSETIGNKVATVAVAATGILLGAFFLLLKLTMWLVGLGFLGFLVHWGWHIIGTGFWWSVLGIFIFLAAAPSLYGVGLQIFMLCIIAVPAICNAIFGET